MVDLIGIGAALAAMRPDDGRRYAGTPMLSALPHAPTVAHRPTLLARLRRWHGRRATRTLPADAGADHEAAPLRWTGRRIQPTGMTGIRSS